MNRLEKAIFCNEYLYNLNNDCFEYTRIGNYFNEMGVKEIGIYGYGMMGQTISRFLTEKKIGIKWIMDERAEIYNNDKIELVKSGEKNVQSVDLVVCTLADYDNYLKIRKYILDKYGFDCVSVYQILDDLKYESFYYLHFIKNISNDDIGIICSKWFSKNLESDNTYIFDREYDKTFFEAMTHNNYLFLGSNCFSYYEKKICSEKNVQIIPIEELLKAEGNSK